MSSDSATGHDFPAPSRVESEPIYCPLCDYDLRGQLEPRCPECGYRFDWNELRDPARRRHRYLFEHHPERNLWSLIRTFFGTLRPQVFWGELYPSQPSRLGRLLVYWALVCAVCLVPCIGICILQSVEVSASNQRQRPMLAASLTLQQKAMVTKRFGSLQAYLDHELPVWPSPRVLFQLFTRWRPSPLLLSGLITLSWTWLTFAALMIFQMSMRRAKVHAAHVLRCVIYSIGASMWIALATAALIAYTILRPSPGFWRWYSLDAASYVLSFGLFVLLSYQLWLAYRKYLRFGHALATALASQVMVALLIFKFALDWGFLR